MPQALQNKIRESLKTFGEASLSQGALSLLNSLGYESQRTGNAGSVSNFLDRFHSKKKLTNKQHTKLNVWMNVEIVFQLTSKEINKTANEENYAHETQFEEGRIKSFLFLAVELPGSSYSRTDISEMTRSVNRLFAMPTVVLYKYKTATGEPILTIAVIHRRPHKIDEHRDVLERVTLIKDIRTNDPHRAHLDILNELSASNLIHKKINTFDELFAAWENTLDTEALNARFYKDLFEWFQSAVRECKFPDDKAGSGSDERHVIRMITRLLFIWFMKEKGLVPECLFDIEFTKKILIRHIPSETDYYRAVLQNLFFATLNTPIKERRFSQASGKQISATNFKHKNLIKCPKQFTNILNSIPFVNGGLFDCLDENSLHSNEKKLVDAFTDNSEDNSVLCVPASLFFNEPSGLFPLFRRYKFTVEESTPLDCEVALDPELLGRVFENLLAAYNPETRESCRKTSGSFYTPRRIVDYMVRESLAEAVIANSNIPSITEDLLRVTLHRLFDHSNDMEDIENFFSRSQRRLLVETIARLRILDPAVGSGAFPMGILQTLTLALGRLDPSNTYLKERHKLSASNQARKTADLHNKNFTEQHDFVNAISTEKTNLNYYRKLYLIQNSIFGLDIQSIACQITKLRIFISLVIEQNADPSQSNLGILPLPNLETHIIAADALLELMCPKQLELGQLDSVNVLEQKLISNRKLYFYCHPSEKFELQLRDAQLRADLASELEASGMPSTSANAICDWNPYNQSSSCHWFDSELMFGITDGFDIVIGNPPYRPLKKDKGLLRKRYESSEYEIFSTDGDIYQLFYEKGCNLLKSQTGVLAYITSNSWLKAQYGTDQRRWLGTHHSPISLIEMGKDVFKQAAVDVSVIIIREGKSNAPFPAVDMDNLSDKTFPPDKKFWSEVHIRNQDPWIVLSKLEKSILDKMLSTGTPLKNWDISFYYGIKTGCNEAFLVDKNTKQKLISDDPRSAEILKPILRGEDIERYQAKCADLWLISTFPSVNLNIDLYPAIKQHLLSFGAERLAQDGKVLADGVRSRKKTPHAWYELQDTCAYHKEFDKEKIFCMDLTNQGRFCFESTEIYCVNTACFLTGHSLKYLCGVLNSKLVTWFMTNTALKSGMGVTRWVIFTVERIPVPDGCANLKTRIATLVDEVLDKKKYYSAANTSEIENEIDDLVYKLYSLNESQCRFMHNWNQR